MKKIAAILFISLPLFLLLTSCKEKKITLGDNILYDKEENIHYGNNPEQVMDLYIPHNKKNREKEVFIMIHGGGWRGGNKSQLTLFTLSMMQKFPDYIFANINYRLASQTQYAIPNQTDDIKKVTELLKNKLGYNPRVILLGNSAGGHLSMLYAYKFDPDKKIKAVINIVGPADLSDSGFKTYDDYAFTEQHLVDPKILPQGTSAVNFASPVHWISKSSPPTLSYYGKKDYVIPLTQKKILDSVLDKNSINHESYEFTGGHLDWDKEPQKEFLIDKIEAFLKKIDKK
ncbi:alpha/beta hydrolase [Chryseobacterium sp. Tr-659]|uniref:alpha/beta hydrolase n=1 Tax=Chryseobacterium sp. Tr-659 TaxID=2608340 RepID=UPI00141DD198|nr:alpha/beta hydrolase [Chryseobacterium sp. Tr-659]NIF05331.1 alpha/beta hydrolase [Chryseobacterium sp. Tr-659]